MSNLRNALIGYLAVNNGIKVLTKADLEKIKLLEGKVSKKMATVLNESLTPNLYITLLEFIEVLRYLDFGKVVHVEVVDEYSISAKFVDIDGEDEEKRLVQLLKQHAEEFNFASFRNPDGSVSIIARLAG